jgi:HSP20 family protein
MYRRYRVPALWREFDKLQREMNHLFDDYTPRRLRQASGFPAMNAWENQDGLIITAELPGVNPDDIDISVVGETLTLSGSRKSEEQDEGARYHRRERGFGEFTRSVQLPFQVKVDDVDATFNNGILQVQLPRAEEDKPKKIAVKSA